MYTESKLQSMYRGNIKYLKEEFSQNMSEKQINNYTQYLNVIYGTLFIKDEDFNLELDDIKGTEKYIDLKLRLNLMSDIIIDSEIDCWNPLKTEKEEVEMFLNDIDTDENLKLYMYTKGIIYSYHSLLEKSDKLKNMYQYTKTINVITKENCVKLLDNLKSSVYYMSWEHRHLVVKDLARTYSKLAEICPDNELSDLIQYMSYSANRIIEAKKSTYAKITTFALDPIPNPTELSDSSKYLAHVLQKNKDISNIKNINIPYANTKHENIIPTLEKLESIIGHMFTIKFILDEYGNMNEKSMRTLVDTSYNIIKQIVNMPNDFPTK